MAVRGWPSNLRWNQFRTIAQRPADVDEDAQIQTDTKPPSRVQIREEAGQLRLAGFDVHNVLVRAGCWVVRGTATAALLKHEQGHWDIAGLCAFEFYRELQALRATSPAALQSGVTAALRRMKRKAQGLQDQYDGETHHSAQQTEQARWDTLIQDAIRHGYRALPPPP